jgi:hypothetical protein
MNRYVHQNVIIYFGVRPIAFDAPSLRCGVNLGRAALFTKAQRFTFGILQTTAGQRRVLQRSARRKLLPTSTGKARLCLAGKMWGLFFLQIPVFGKE